MHSRSKSAMSLVENEKLKVTSTSYFTIHHSFATLEEALKVILKIKVRLYPKILGLI
jgi:hypothetical protein